MSCVYVRGKSLWIAYKDERGLRVCRPSGYKVGEEVAAQAVAAELDRKAIAAQAPRSDAHEEGRPPMVAPTVLDMPTTLIPPVPAALPPLALSPLTGPLAITVREYGERW